MNIHQKISYLQRLLEPETVPSDEASSQELRTEKERLIGEVFSALILQPLLSETENSFVHRLYSHLLDLPVNQYPATALQVLNYQNIIFPKQPAPFPDRYPFPDMRWLLFLPGLESIQSDSKKTKIFLDHMKTEFFKGGRLSLEELGLTVLPSCFLTEPFFERLQLQISKHTSLPPIPLSWVRNEKVLEQFLRQTGSRIQPVDATSFESLLYNREIGKLSQGKGLETRCILEKRKQTGRNAPILPPSDITEYKKIGAEIEEENLHFLRSIQTSTSIRVDLNTISRIDAEILVQRIQDQNLRQFFRKIFQDLPEEIRNVCRMPNDLSPEWIRQLLKEHKTSIESIENLSVNNAGLRCIPPEIRYFKNLRILDISDNKIAECTALAKLPFLTWLGAWNNRISNISFLADMQKLEHVDLSNNRIKNISPITCLQKIKYLALSNNPVSNPEILYTVSGVKLLFLENCGLRSGLFLAGLPDLALLDLSNNALPDTELPRRLPVTDLFLADNAISDLSFLSGYKKLKTLDVSANQITTLTPIRNLSLNRLLANRNQIEDLSPLSEHCLLEALELNGNQIRNVAPLLLLPNLKILELEYNNIEDVSDLCRLHQLERLEFSPQNPSVSRETTETNLRILRHSLRGTEASIINEED